MRAGISAIGICRAPSSRQIASSLASRTSRTVCSLPALRMSASSRTETSSDPLTDSVDKAFVAPLRGMTVVHRSDWKPVKKTSKRREVAPSESSSLAPTFTPFVEDREPGLLRLVRQFQAGFKFSAEDLPVRLSGTTSYAIFCPSLRSRMPARPR